MSLLKLVDRAVFDTLDATSSLDADERMKSVGRATSGVVVDFFSSASDIISQPTILDISAATTELSTQMFARLNQLRKEYILGSRGAAPAASHLGRTKLMYEFIRTELKVPMHGRENLDLFADGYAAVGRRTVGYHVSVIFEVCAV